MIKATPFTGGAEAHLPGWHVKRGKRLYTLWAPRAERRIGTFNNGDPVILAARTDWSVSWNDDTSIELSDFWRADSLEQALDPLPGEVSDAFRAAVEEAGL